MHVHPVVPDDQSAVEGASDSLGDLHGYLGLILDQDGEFVPAQSRSGISGADTGLHTSADAAQQFIAGRITQGVVDNLEIVDSDSQHAHRDSHPLVQLHGVGQPFVEESPIRQAGNGVPQGRVGHRIE